MLFEVGNRVSMNEESTIMDIGEVGWNDYKESEEHVVQRHLKEEPGHDERGPILFGNPSKQ